MVYCWPKLVWSGRANSPTAAEFARRQLAGTLVAAFWAGPFLLGPQPHLADRLLASAPLVWLGQRSYGLFLWHLPLVTVVFAATGLPLFAGKFWLIYVLVVALSILVAHASLLLVEQPAQRLLLRPKSHSPSTKHLQPR